jgi:hypothetical protein
MHGDFSRLSFARDKHYAAVLLQQGRALLDADANEHSAITLHQLRTLAEDVLGPYGGPAAALGFEITPVVAQGDQLAELTIGPGRYWVHGILCEVEPAGWAEGAAVPVGYYDQPDRFLDPEDAADRLPNPPFLVYLRVFERLVTAVEDPSMAEPALGANGPDSTVRSKVVWQVLATPQTPGTDEPLPAGLDRDTVLATWPTWEAALRGDGQRGRLRATVRRPGAIQDDPCIVPPTSAYVGGNQLYRVEIHRGGAANDTATFKWSRENGSVALPIVKLEGKEVTLASLGRDGGLALQAEDLVEICDDASALGDVPARLHRVQTIDPVDRRVVLDEEPTAATGRDPDRHPLLRRWDQEVDEQQGADTGNALPVVEPADANTPQEWIPLERGVLVAFPPSGGATYRPGDFWLIPARTTGAVLWPGAPDAPEARPPHGVDRWFAPLALVTAFDQDAVDLRCQLAPLACTAPTTNGSNGNGGDQEEKAEKVEPKAKAAPAKAAAAAERTGSRGRRKPRGKS